MELPAPLLARAMLAVTSVTIIAWASGCSIPNARPGDVFATYQPDLAIDELAVSQQRLGDNEFEITLQRRPRVPLQRNPAWCWAAAIEALLNYDNVRTPTGAEITQDDVIRRLAAARANQAGKVNDIIIALTPELASEYDAAWKEYQDTYQSLSSPTPKTGGSKPQVSSPSTPKLMALVADLCTGHPVLLGVDAPDFSTGHAYVVFSARVSRAAADGPLSGPPYRIHSVRAIDPLDGAEKVLAADTLARTGIALGRPTAKDALVDWIERLRDYCRRFRRRARHGKAAAAVACGFGLKTARWSRPLRGPAALVAVYLAAGIAMRLK